MGEIEDRKVILEKVFLDLEVELPELFNEQQSNKYPIWLREALSDEKRTSALSYLLDDSILGIILIGGPEEGKTTLCQYISQLYRAQLLGRLDDLGEESKRIEKFLPRI